MMRSHSAKKKNRLPSPSGTATTARVTVARLLAVECGIQTPMRHGTRMLDDHIEKSDGLPRTQKSPSKSPMTPRSGSSRVNAAFSGSVTALQAEVVCARRESTRLSSRLSGSTPLRSCEGSEMVVMGKVNKKGRVESTSTRRVQVEALSKSMSAAPVETLSMRRRDTVTELSQRSAGARRLHCLCSTLFPQSSLQGAGKLPLDYIACMARQRGQSAPLGVRAWSLQRSSWRCPGTFTPQGAPGGSGRSALRGRGWATGHPTNASGDRAIRLPRSPTPPPLALA